MITTFGSVARHGRGWLPMIGVTALLSSGTALALPAVLGRSVDAIDGNKAAVGNHTTLLRSSPLYRELLGHWQPGGDQIQPAS